MLSRSYESRSSAGSEERENSDHMSDNSAHSGYDEVRLSFLSFCVLMCCSLHDGTYILVWVISR